MHVGDNVPPRIAVVLLRVRSQGRNTVDTQRVRDGFDNCPMPLCVSEAHHDERRLSWIGMIPSQALKALLNLNRLNKLHHLSPHQLLRKVESESCLKAGIARDCGVVLKLEIGAHHGAYSPHE